MKQALKAIFLLVAALLVVLAVRAYLFTIYTVPADVDSELIRGDRVMVNRLSHAVLDRGDLVVFEQGADVIGRIEAMPGDTLSLEGHQFRIPTRCCDRCVAPDCRLYLVSMGRAKTLVYKHQMVGCAKKLFHLPF